MPRSSSLPDHLVQAIHVPKSHPDVVAAGRGWRSAATRIAERHGAIPGSYEPDSRRVNYVSFGQIASLCMAPATYVTWTGPDGVQTVSARLAPAYALRSLTRLPRTVADTSRSNSVWSFYSDRSFRVAVSTRAAAVGDLPKRATAKALIKLVGRARVRVG